MKTVRVRGVVGNENDENQAWEVLVDLRLDDDKIVDHQQVEFGAAPPPPSGYYKLIYFYRDQRHEAHGHIESRSWRDFVVRK